MTGHKDSLQIQRLEVVEGVEKVPATTILETMIQNLASH
jgi:hypothetical protein